MLVEALQNQTERLQGYFRKYEGRGREHSFLFVTLPF